ncbi:DUF4232 domain-containing protein [Microtetraspora sp. NBRC 16547]|uniref:DUF4232 domain-containing protein n=1 Tax=Microtetraspora sp. NBRC 16547 TaxID=3030993 RepID=UPI0024A593C2|nr:DUF4232 domain-containing protein [Microtetraspora sp. NBRC 16547]GLW96733.1 hypothetical protein Misp02_08200 [Microtetraspora sp. NBRC 16547]
MSSMLAGNRRGLALYAGLLTASTLLTACVVSPSAKVSRSKGPPPKPDPTLSSTAQTAPPCPESGVVITTGEVDAAMGLRALSIEMVNCGDHRYRVKGFPSIRVLDPDRRPLDVKVGNGTSSIALIDGYDTKPMSVTLKPGEKAVAGLVWRNTMTDPTVTATIGSYLEIAPVDGEPPQTVPQYVDLGNTGKLGVTAWARLR